MKGIGLLFPQRVPWAMALIEAANNNLYTDNKVPCIMVLDNVYFN